MHAKKKTRYGFYKSLQITAFHMMQLQELLNLGLTVPEQEAGPTLAFIDQFGAGLRNIHTTLQEQYKAPTPT